MYPTLHIRGLSLSMTGLGVVSFLLVFILVAKKKAAAQGVQFRLLLRYLPFMIMISYLLGTWSWYFRSDFIIFPLDPKQWLLYLSPYEYHFHFSGVIAGLAIGRWKFLQTQRRETHVRWWTILFESLCLATIPLGIFFLFGDHFIGKPIDTGRYISAIDPISKVAAYDKVIPLGGYLAAGSGLLYLAIMFISQKKPKIYRAFPGLMLYWGFIALVLLWQLYPRHIVAKIGSITFDVKQYFCFLLIGLIARQWRLTQRSSSLESSSHETNLLT